MTNTLGKIIADFNAVLTLKVAVGATTATISTATDDDGVALPAGSYYFTIDRNSSSKEYIYCTLSGTSLSAIQSVSRQGVLTSGFARTHRAKTATVEITDFAIIKKMLDLLDGTTDLDASIPLKYDATATISNANHLATKAYVDGVAIAGAPDASTTVKGVTKLSVAPVSASEPIAYGSNDTSVMTQVKYQAGAEIYGTDVGGDDTYVVALAPILSAYTPGQRLNFKPTTANTGACSVNFGPSVLNIKTKDGNDPQSGVIRANVEASGCYDGTNFVLDTEDFATTASKGSVELSTDAEAESGTDTARAITPYQLANSNKTFVQSVVSEGNAPYFSCVVGGFSTSEPFFSIATSSGAPIITRYIKRGDGSIIATHKASMTNASAGQSGTICVVGDYVYCLSTVAGSPSMQRCDKANLANMTNITVSGTAMGGSTPLFTDGTDIWNMFSGATARVYTISGTTVTSGTTRSYTSATTGETYWCDGTNLWSINGTAGSQFAKWSFASGGARTTSTAQYLLNQWKISLGTTQANYGGIMKDVMESNKLYTIISVGDATCSIGKILPIDTF